MHASRLRGPFFQGILLASSYAVLCALVTTAVRLAAHRPISSLPVTNPLLPWQMVAFLVAAAVVVGLFIRKINGRTAWELILGATIFLGVWFFFWVAFSGELGLLVASVLTLLQAWVRRVFVHDVFMLLGVAGVALNFAFLFPTQTLVVLLVGLAVYDIFAGRAGGVSARFAASLVHRGVVPGLIVPGHPAQLMAPITEAIRQPDAVFLGAGDLILPVIFVARAAGAGIGPACAVSAGLLVAAGWLGSRGATKPFPALVPLAVGTLVPFSILMLTHLV